MLIIIGIGYILGVNYENVLIQSIKLISNKLRLNSLFVYLMDMDVVKVKEFGFTDRVFEFEKEIGNSTYKAEYYPAGYNVVRASWSNYSAGMLRYALCVKYLNPEITRDKLYMHVGLKVLEKELNISASYIRWMAEKAFEVEDFSGIIQTKRVRFLNYAAFLKAPQKSAWTQEIKGSFMLKDVSEFFNEYPKAQLVECAEALGISRASVIKYKKMWKLNNKNK